MFAPIARPPRAPWVNPDRRWHVLAVAVVSALILLGGGIAIGAAANGGHGSRSGVARIERGGHRAGPDNPGGVRRGPGFGDGNANGKVQPRVRNAPTNLPSVVPS
ncbi:MAG: hypothetical protein ABI368_01065, partial [Jatrophihabitantaceae bacterium]